MPTVLFTKENAKLMQLRSMAKIAKSKGELNATVIHGDEAARLFARSADNPLAARSNYVRGTLADILVRSVDVLKNAPWRAGMKHAMERGEAVQLLATSAARVFGWSDEADRPMLVIGDMRPVIDVQPAACGLDTTTGGMPAIECNTSTPQDAAKPC